MRLEESCVLLMKLSSKEQLIVNFLEDKSIATVDDICSFSELSAATVRRYLIKLEEKGVICRVHGGASLNRELVSSPSIGEKISKNHKQKVLIAQKAVALISDQDSIALDAGSTTLEIAKLLTQSVNVITPDLNIGLVLARNQQIDVALTGGKVDFSAQSCIGQHSLAFIKKVHPLYAFIGCNGWSIESGITTPTSDKASLKSALLNQSKIKVLVADSSKYNKSQLYEVCALKDLDIIITDSDLPLEVRDQITALGIELIICE